MRRILSIGIALFMGFKASAQQAVIDVAAISTIVTTHTVENANFTKMAKSENKIAVLQTKIALRQEQIRLLQKKVYDAQKSAMSWVTTVTGVTRAYSIAEDIVDYETKIFDVASGDAVLTSVALAMQLKIADRSYALLQDIVAALLGGEIAGKPINLMDSKQRLDLINRVNKEMRLLRGLVYGVYRKIRRVKRIGVFESAKQSVLGSVIPRNSLVTINRVKLQYF